MAGGVEGRRGGRSRERLPSAAGSDREVERRRGMEERGGGGEERGWLTGEGGRRKHNQSSFFNVKLKFHRSEEQQLAIVRYDGMARPEAQQLKHLPFVSDIALPNSSLFSDLLQSCIESSSLDSCRKLHARILKFQFSSETFILNRLIDACFKCGSHEHDRNLFDVMPQRNTSTWNAVISAFTRSGNIDEARRLFASVPFPHHCSWSSMVSGFPQHRRFEESLLFFEGMLERTFT